MQTRRRMRFCLKSAILSGASVFCFSMVCACLLARAAEAPASPQKFGFLGPEIFPIEYLVSHLRAADINGDGLLDLVVANNARSKINILFNQTGKTNVQIDFGFINSKFQYAPRCLKVSRCTMVTFKCQGEPCDFVFHPLQGGNKNADPKSPFGFNFAAKVQEKSFVMKDKGSFGYYCVAHQDVDMAGAVFVE